MSKSKNRIYHPHTPHSTALAVMPTAVGTTAFVLLMLLQFVCCPNTWATVKPLHFEQVQTKVNFNLVRAIYRDSSDYLWVGNDGTGLVRYDGYVGQAYLHKQSDSRSLSNDAVLCIAQDHKSRLWVGTRNGLNRYLPEQDAFKVYLGDSAGQGARVIYCVFEDDARNLWVGTDKGLYIWSEGLQDFQHYNAGSPVLASAKICSMAQSWPGVLWVATFGEGLFHFNVSEGTCLRFDDARVPFRSGRYKKLYVDSRGTLWIGSAINGLTAYNPNTDEFRKYPTNGGGQGTNGKSVYDILEYGEGDLLVGVDQGGINRLNLTTGTFDYIMADGSSSSGLSNNGIYCFFRDRENILWVGTSRGGVNMSNPKNHRFQLYQNQCNSNRSLSHNIVGCFLEDFNGDVWVGTDGGGISVLSKETNRFSYFRNEPNEASSLSGNVVRSMVLDKDNDIWVGTWDFGLNHFDRRTRTFQRYMPDPSDSTAISSRVVWAMHVSADSLLWLGSYVGGVDVFKKGHGVIRRFVANEGQTNNPFGVNYITGDSWQTVWVCARNGLFRYPKGRKHFEPIAALVGIGVSTMVQGTGGKYWVGTEKEGVLVMDSDGKVLDRFNVDNGLTDNHVCGIQLDDSNGVWISTHNGLSYLLLYEQRFRTFTQDDGLQGNQFFVQSSMKASDGKLYFGGTKGFTSFYPDSLHRNDYEPPVYLTDFLLFNKSVPFGPEQKILKQHIRHTKKIELQYHQSVLTFGFSAVGYTHPQKSNYAYYMDGFEDDWNYVGTQQFANYTNLNPGSYTFRVKTSNNDQVWSPKQLAIELVILPPIWRTNWFRLLATALLIGLSLLLYWLRVRALKEQKRILEITVSLRTHELRKANQVLHDSKEEIMQQNEEIKNQNELIQSSNDDILVKNFQLEKQKHEISKQYRNMELVGEFGQHITAALNVEVITRRLYDYIRPLMKTTSLGIGLFSPNNGQLIYPAFYRNGKKQSSFIRKISQSNSLSVWVLKNQKPIFINDLQAEYLKYLEELPVFADDEMNGSCILLPLSVERKRIGVLFVTCHEKNAYTSSDFSNLKALRAYISIALDNANAYHTVEAQHSKIADSINYAKHIQQAILPIKSVMQQHLDMFLLFRPKDVVAGDFYWFKVKGQGAHQKVFVAVVDCTGHGVPGAFMSMIGTSLLNQIVDVEQENDLAKILELLDAGVIERLKQHKNNNDDGMDVCLCCFESTDKPELGAVRMRFAGARRPLYLLRHRANSIDKLHGSVHSVGGHLNLPCETNFYEETLYLEKGDRVYLSSDGYQDQNNAKRKKFGLYKLLNLLVQTSYLPLSKQGEVLQSALDEHQGGEEQRDDITLLGVQV